jgi:hypothetical protein
MLVANRASTEVIDVFIDPQRNQKRGVKEKKCEPGEARERQHDKR